MNVRCPWPAGHDERCPWPHVSGVDPGWPSLPPSSVTVTLGYPDGTFMDVQLAPPEVDGERWDVNCQAGAEVRQAAGGPVQVDGRTVRIEVEGVYRSRGADGAPRVYYTVTSRPGGVVFAGEDPTERRVAVGRGVRVIDLIDAYRRSDVFAAAAAGHVPVPAYEVTTRHGFFWVVLPKRADEDVRAAVAGDCWRRITALTAAGERADPFEDVRRIEAWPAW